MKRLLLLGLTVLCFNIFGQNFPGNDVQLLLGKELKVKELSTSLQSYGYDGFYTDSKLKKKYACCQSYNSKYESLAGKIFKVISSEPYTDNIGKNKFKLKIENSETGIIYFDYNPKYEHTFPFEVIGGIEFPDGFFCKDIEEAQDKFTQDITFRSPISEGISFIRVKKGSSMNTYLSIRVHGSTVNVDGKGVILLLDNGNKIQKPDEKIDVEVSSNGSGYTYSAFINLNESDIALLTQNKLTDVRLYIYDGNVRNGGKLMEYIKCIKDK